MLHGVALYTLFMLVIGAERSARLSDWRDIARDVLNGTETT